MKMDYENTKNNYLDISFGPKWDYIPLTRNYIENFLFYSISNKLKITKIIIATSELLENAIKYSCDNGVRTQIKRNKKKHKIELAVRNSVRKEDAYKLIDYIEEINLAPDPFKYYLDKMRESISRKDGKTGLGLSRIKYEGEAFLTAKFFDREDGTGIVEVKAIFDI